MSQADTFQNLAILSSQRWREPEKYSSHNAWLHAIESQATTLLNLAELQDANELKNLCNALVNLVKTALETGYEIELTALESSFAALENAKNSSQVLKAIKDLTAIEDTAAMFVPDELLIVNKKQKPDRWTRILTVDDSGLVRSALKRIFYETGASLEEAKNGTEAVAKISEISKYDLILLDLEMPDLSGIEVLEQIRRASQDVVVMMLTSSEDIKKAIINKEGEYEVGITSAGVIQWAFANTTPGWNWEIGRAHV